MRLKHLPLYLTVNVCLIAFICGLGYWTFIKKTAALELDQDAAVETRIAGLMQGWIAKQVSPEARILQIVVPDSEEGTSVLHQPPSEETSFGERFSVIWGRIFGRAPAPVRLLPDQNNVLDWHTDALTWTKEKDRRVKAMAEVIVKASQAGAKIDIVAQGRGAALAAQAIAQTQALVQQGVKVEVERFVALGSNQKRLQATSGWGSWFADSSRMGTMKKPAGFTRPPQIKEWVNIWTEGSGHSRTVNIPETVNIEVYVMGRPAVRLTGNEYLLGKELLTTNRLYYNNAEILAAVTKMLRQGGSMNDYIQAMGYKPPIPVPVVKPVIPVAEVKKEEKDYKGMVLIPAGEFLMGSPKGVGRSDEHPRHKVYLDAYYMDKTEVTFAAYEKCAAAGECPGAHVSDGTCYIWIGRAVKQGNLPASFQGEEKPVVCVDWEQAGQYCKWAGKRLPTEAEWEKAARGGTNTKYSFGDDEKELGKYAWYNKNSGARIHLVGQKKPNQYGLYDMHGNVVEWVSDWYDYYETYYKNSPKNNPKGQASGTSRSLRGGSWHTDVDELRAAFSSTYVTGNWLTPDYSYTPGDRFDDIGFRCVVPAPKPAPQVEKPDYNQKGNAANCNGNSPICNWWDAKAYCGGLLPSVAQLKSDYQKECTGGRQGNTCGYWYWSSEETSAEYARSVTFSGGVVRNGHKGNGRYVRCR